VEDSEFQQFLAHLQPKFTLPERRKVSKVLVPAHRVRLEAIIQVKLKGLSDYAITFDGWSSLANIHYVAITLHGIDENWELLTFLLDMLPTKDGEKAVHIADMVRETFEDWKLSLGRVVSVSSDATPAMISAVAELGLSWFNCMAHAINLAVKEGLLAIEMLVKRCNRICTFFHKSCKAAKVLLEQEKLLGVSEKKLTRHVPMRWSSTCEMFERLLTSRPAVSATLGTVRGTRKSPPSDLTSQEWSDLKDMVQSSTPSKTSPTSSLRIAMLRSVT
jgi:hypothetical protein